MRILPIAVALIGAAILQVTFVDLISVFSIEPNLPLIVLLFFVPRRSIIEGLGLAFLSGLLLDLLAGSPLGLSSLSLSVAAFLVGAVSRDWVEVDYQKMARLFLLGSLAFEVIFNGVYLLGSELGPVGGFLRYALPGAVYDVGIGMLILAALPREWWRKI